MTTLVWMLSWLPLVLPAMSELPKPVNVSLTTNHFSHILKWEPGPGTPTGTYFLVSITTERGTWMPVAGCERVQQPLVCNLTEAFSDPLESYMTRVQAHNSSQSATISGYKPIMHMGLPLLTVKSCDRVLCVNLHPPKEHLRKTYDSLSYQLKIRSNDGTGYEFVKDIHSLKGENLSDLAPGREYCVSVCFSDGLEGKKSNFSEPVCAVTPGIFSEDPLISAVSCLLVVVGVVVLALLVGTGSICLRKRPLPTVLASIHHMENVLHVALSTPLLSLLEIWPTAPSPGEKRSRSSLSDVSDEESATESTGGSTGGGYNLRPCAGLLSSSSSSSSLSTPLTPKPEPPPPGLSSKQHLDFFNSQPKGVIPSDMHSSAGLKHSLITDSLTGEESKADKTEHKAGEEEDSQDVNLLTLTFGRQEENKEEEEEKSYRNVTRVEQECYSPPEECSSTEVSQPSGSKEVATKTVSWCADEEEEEDPFMCSGYMERTCS